MTIMMILANFVSLRKTLILELYCQYGLLNQLKIGGLR